MPSLINPERSDNIGEVEIVPLHLWPYEDAKEAADWIEDTPVLADQAQRDRVCHQNAGAGPAAGRFDVAKVQRQVLLPVAAQMRRQAGRRSSTPGPREE